MKPTPEQMLSRKSKSIADVSSLVQSDKVNLRDLECPTMTQKIINECLNDQLSKININSILSKKSTVPGQVNESTKQQWSKVEKLLNIQKSIPLKNKIEKSAKVRMINQEQLMGMTPLQYNIQKTLGRIDIYG